MYDRFAPAPAREAGALLFWHYGKMALKIYTQGATVLRIEVILNNAKAYRWGRSLPCFGEIVLRVKVVLERVLNAAGCIDGYFVSDETLEQLLLPPRPPRVCLARHYGTWAEMPLADAKSVDNRRTSCPISTENSAYPPISQPHT